MTKGVKVTGSIVPANVLDEYATNIDNFGKGGVHSVATLIDRDATTLLRRSVGMLCYVQEDSSVYILATGVTNSDWQKLYYVENGKLIFNINLLKNYILLGGSDDLAYQSLSFKDAKQDIIDLRKTLDLLKFLEESKRRELDDMSNAHYILQSDLDIEDPSISFPNAQFLKNLSGLPGMLFSNISGVVSTVALKAGTNITIDSTTEPGKYIINSTGGGSGGVVTLEGAVNGSASIGSSIFTYLNYKVDLVSATQLMNWDFDNNNGRAGELLINATYGNQSFGEGAIGHSNLFLSAYGTDIGSSYQYVGYKLKSTFDCSIAGTPKTLNFTLSYVNATYQHLPIFTHTVVNDALRINSQLVIPSGTTFQRTPTPVLGSIRINTDNSIPYMELYGYTQWHQVGGGGGGATSLTGAVTGSIVGSNIDTKLALDQQLLVNSQIDTPAFNINFKDSSSNLTTRISYQVNYFVPDTGTGSQESIIALNYRLGNSTITPLQNSWRWQELIDLGGNYTKLYIGATGVPNLLQNTTFNNIINQFSTVWSGNLSVLGTFKINNTMDANNQIISNVKDPINPQDAVNLRTLQSASASSGRAVCQGVISTYYFSNLAVGDHLKFNSIIFYNTNIENVIMPDTTSAYSSVQNGNTASIGRITLALGFKYKLSAGLGAVSGELASVQWYEMVDTTNTPLGNNAIFSRTYGSSGLAVAYVDLTSVGSDNNQDGIIIIPTNRKYELRITGQINNLDVIETPPWFTVETL